MPAALIDIEIDGPGVAAFLALFGVFVTLWVNGDRAERERRRELHARALAAIMKYGEMPFMVRRRRHEASERSAERVRLSTQFSGVQAEVSTCQVLLSADGNEELAEAYAELAAIARRTAGRETHDAWTEEPINSDAEMNMPELFERLSDFRLELDRFEKRLAHATLPRRSRAWHRLRSRPDDLPRLNRT